MPKVITINEHNETLFDDVNDFAYYIDKYMGMEARNHFLSIIDAKNETIVDLQQEINDLNETVYDLEIELDDLEELVNADEH